GLLEEDPEDTAGEDPFGRAEARRLAATCSPTLVTISSKRYRQCYDALAMTANEDFLTEIIAERTARNPEFPGLVDAALRRRELLRALGAQREKLGLSQTAVAAVMGTSQSAVARLEAGDVDAKLSTVERYAAALGRQVEWRIAKAPR